MLMCPYCDKTAPGPQLLKSHARRTHGCDHTPAELANALADARTVEDVNVKHEGLTQSVEDRCAELLASNARRLAQVRVDIDELKVRAYETAVKIEAMDMAARMTNPVDIRNGSLIEAVEELRRNGFHRAAVFVQRMIPGDAQ